MEVAQYLRKSRLTTGMETDETLERHRAALAEYAHREGLHIIEEYSEVATGESLYARPEMLRLLTDIEGGKYEAVLCMDLDRLSRGRMRDQGIILDALRNANCKIITPEKTYDLDDEIDDELAEFKTFMSRREYKIITKRLQRGLRQSVKEGCYVSNAPYGYSKVVVDKKPTLEIVDHEADFVRMMFDMYENGAGCQMIANHVSALGATPRRSASFGRGSVAKILRNPVYCGKVVWNQVSHVRKGARGNDKHYRIYNAPEQWVVTEGLHPAIIQQSQFDTVQALYKQHYHPPSNDGSLRNPFAGLIRCKKCGGRIQMQKSTAYKGGPRLLCNTAGCSASVSIGYAEEYILTHLNDYMQKLSAEAPRKSSAGEAKAAKLMAAAQMELKQAEAQKSKLYELLERGVYDTVVFRERMALIKERIDSITKRTAELDHAIIQSTNADAQLAAKRIGNVLDAYTIADVGGKNRLLKSIIQTVLYEKHKKTKPQDFAMYITLRPDIFIES